MDLWQKKLIGALIAGAGASKPVAAVRRLEQAVVLLAQAAVADSAIMNSAELEQAIHKLGQLKQVAIANTPAATKIKAEAVDSFNGVLRAYGGDSVRQHAIEEAFSDGLNYALEAARSDTWESTTPLMGAAAACGWMAEGLMDSPAKQSAVAAARWVDRMLVNQASWLAPEPFSMRQARNAIATFNDRFRELHKLDHRVRRLQDDFEAGACTMQHSWFRIGIAIAIGITAFVFIIL